MIIEERDKKNDIVTEHIIEKLTRHEIIAMFTIRKDKVRVREPDLKTSGQIFWRPGVMV